MQWPSEFLLSVSISGVTGAMLSISIERFLKYKSRSLKNKELFKTWYSTWQPCLVDDWDQGWVEEVITLRNTWRGIRLKNDPMNKDFEWEGEGRLFESEYFYGHWYSTKALGSAKGLFTLAKSAGGDYFFGYLIAHDLSKQRIANGFVLGRDLKAMRRGRKKLESMRNELSEIVMDSNQHS